MTDRLRERHEAGEHATRPVFGCALCIAVRDAVRNGYKTRVQHIEEQAEELLLSLAAHAEKLDSSLEKELERLGDLMYELVDVAKRNTST